MFYLKYRIPIIVTLITVTVFMGIGLTKITKETGIEALMPEGNKEYIFFKEMEAVFGATDQMVIGITFSDSVYMKDNLKLIREFSDFFENDISIDDDDVLSLSTINNIDGIDQELLIEAIIPENKEITDHITETVRGKVRDNDMLRGKIVSIDEKSTAIIVTVDTSVSFNAEILEKLINRASLKIDELKTLRPDIEIYRSGMVSVKYATSEYMERDMSVMFPIAIAVVFILLLILLRSISGAIVPLLVTLFSVIWTLGLKGWIGSPLTMAETIIPIMLIAIGCADGVHIIGEFLTLTREGLSSKEAISKTMKNLNVPIILTSLTTSLGFLSLITAPGVSVRNMGIFLGFGVITAMLFSLVFIPALLTFRKDKNNINISKIKKTDLSSIGRFIIKNRVVIGLSSLCFFILSIFGMLNISVETDQIRFLKKSNPLRISTEKLQESLGGVNTLDVIVQGRENSFKDPETLKFINELQIYANSAEIVGYTLSLVDYIKKIYYEFNDKNKSFNRIPDTVEIIDGEEVPGQDIISGLLFLYEMGGGDKLEKVVTDDYSMGKVSIRLLDTSQIGMEEFVADLDNWIRMNKPGNLSISYTNDYVRIVMGNLITKGQIRSFISTLIAIIFLLMIIFRSPLSGILTALPVVIAVSFNFAVMWITGTTLNIGTSLIASVGMGVGIDYAIHFFQRYKNQYLKTGDNHGAIIYALNESAISIMSNSIAVGIGFLTLLFSNYYIIAGIGWITGLSMITTSVFALTVLPAFLGIFEPLKKRHNKEKEIIWKRA